MLRVCDAKGRIRSLFLLWKEGPKPQKSLWPPKSWYSGGLTPGFAASPFAAQPFAGQTVSLYMALLELTDKGLYCAAGDFYIDPWRAVDRAVLTHAHADHARYGSRFYLAHRSSASVLRLRLGKDIPLQTLEYNEPLYLQGVRVSLHPAGHIPGSAQVRVECKGEVWVASGDYKLRYDGLSPAFEPVRCHHFITESTFGLPLFRFPPQEQVFQDIHQWWEQNRREGFSTVLFAYSLGKAQRLIKHLNPASGPMFVHSAIRQTNQALQADGWDIPELPLPSEGKKEDLKGALVLAPPSAARGTWLKAFGPARLATASGWMALRGARRRQALDRGFLLSDHADWDELHQAIEASEAAHIWVTHGYRALFVRHLQDLGYEASVLETPFAGEEAEADA